jgi:sucrose phosphorylase
MKEQIMFTKQDLHHIPLEKQDSMIEKLSLLYGNKEAMKLLVDIDQLINKHLEQKPTREEDYIHWLNEEQVVLITYGDQIKEDAKPPLQSLFEFLQSRTGDVLTGIHILPFYPYSSDDGFSVIDFEEVNPELGTWEDITRLSQKYNVMFDYAVNHISQHSEWFKEYLNCNSAYENYFIEKPADYDARPVTRPRPWSLLHEFQRANGEVKYIWTTFSQDQIDLNYKNPALALKMLEILLFYTRQGARMIRMDAVGYLWKEDGTSCINLPQTHSFVQLMRDILDIAAPATRIVTETNVPHEENVSYFGDGHNEAHMVYNFSLPPLVLNAFISRQISHLANWASILENENLTEDTGYFNFLASHDGIGLMPAQNLIPVPEIEEMVEKVRQRGGRVSMKTNTDGTQSPYELNINYFDALSDHHEDLETRIDRFIAAQAILLSFRGVPGIYIHSLLGSSNYYDSINPDDQMTYRSINRQKFYRNDIENALDNPGTQQHKIFNRFKGLIELRKKEKAFHPNARQRVLFFNEKILSLLRTSEDETEEILAMVNVADTEEIISMPMKKEIGTLTDLLTATTYTVPDIEQVEFNLKPNQVMWLKSYKQP